MADAAHTTPPHVLPFVFEGAEIRVTDRDGDPWFVANDVCTALGLSDARQALDKLDGDERAGCSIPTPSGTQEMRCISESGLYALVLRCRDAMTPGTVPHRFRKWVTAEVLPSIRRTGQYAVGASAAPVPRKIATVARSAEEIAAELRTALCLVERPNGLFAIEIVAGIFEYEPKRMHAYLRRHFLKKEGEFFIPERPASLAAMFQVWAKHDAAGDLRLTTLVTPRGLVHLADRLDLGQISVSTMRNDVVS